MDFMTAVKSCFSKYVTFSGRAQRSEFWWFVLFGMGMNIILSILDGMMFGATTQTFDYGFEISVDRSVFGSLFSLVVFLPSISAAVRRLHDTDRSGWWWWLILIPLVGWIILIIWYASPGTGGKNRFGNDPLGGSGGHNGHSGYDDGDDDYSRSRIPNVSND